MGEARVIDLDAYRHRPSPAQRRERPNVTRFSLEYPEHTTWLAVVNGGTVAHDVDEDMTAGMRAGLAEFQRAGRVILRIGANSVWTYCGVHGAWDPPGPDTLVCLRCFPWWRA